MVVVVLYSVVVMVVYGGGSGINNDYFWSLDADFYAYRCDVA